MILLIIIFICLIVWISYEVWKAPLLDNNYRVIRPTKTLKDLFKYKNKK